MRLEINYRKKNCKKHKHMEAKQYVTKQPMGHWRNQKEIKNYQETNDNENMAIQNLWDAAKAVLKREVYSNTILMQEKIGRASCRERV